MLEDRNRKEMETTNENMVQAIKTIDEEIARMEDIKPPPKVEDPELTNNYLQSLEG